MRQCLSVRLCVSSDCVGSIDSRQYRLNYDACLYVHVCVRPIACRYNYDNVCVCVYVIMITYHATCTTYLVEISTVL